MKVKFDRLCDLGLISPGGNLCEPLKQGDFHVLDIHELRESKQQLMIYAIGPDAAGDAEIHAATFAYARRDPVPVRLSPEEERAWAERLMRRAETMKKMRALSEKTTLRR